MTKCLEDKYFSHILLRIIETIYTFFQGDSQGGGVKGIPTASLDLGAMGKVALW
jgi:hypothetical protein